MGTKTTQRSKSEAEEQGAMGAENEEIAFAGATLAEFGDSWKRPKDFEEEAEIISTEPERCEKQTIRRMTAEETRETTHAPPSTFEEIREERVAFEDRYDLAHDDFLDETIEYACSSDDVSDCGTCNASGKTDCPKCTTGEVRCGTCGGDGMEVCGTCSGWVSKGGSGRISCPDCSGSGTRKAGDQTRTCGTCAGDGHVMCNSCSGSGEHRCTNCGGGGIVTCGTCGGRTEVVCGSCNGETKIVTFDVGSITFESTTEQQAISETDVPERYIVNASGTKFRTDEDWNDVTELDEEQLVRESIEREHVDTVRIDYSYDGDEYSLFDIEGMIRAPEYPKSRGRSLLPWALLAALLMVGSYGVYVYFL